MKITIAPSAFKRIAELYEGEHLAEKLNDLVRIGPVEMRLRFFDPKLGWKSLNILADETPVWECITGAAESLGISADFILTNDYDVDVLSEAIEAAEALGL